MALARRPAVADDCPALSALALRSKGHWGDDAAFLDARREELTVDAARLDTEHVAIAEGFDAAVSVSGASFGS